MPRLKNIKHEKFAQAIVKGLSQAEAYRKVFGKKPSGEAASANRLRGTPLVDARITELLQEDTPSAGKCILVAGKELKDISKDEAIHILLEMLELSPNDAENSSPLCDVKYVGKFAEKVAVTPDRIRVMERIAAMKGWNKEVLELNANKKLVDIVKGGFAGPEDQIGEE